MAPELSCRPLPRQQARQGRDERCRGADRSEQDQDPELYPGGTRGSYRSAPIGLENDQALSRPDPLRTRRIWSYRGGRKSTLIGQISVLEDRKSTRLNSSH